MAKKIMYRCCDCGGTELVSDGSFEWNTDTQAWEPTGTIYDDTYCNDCERDVRIEEVDITN